MKTREATHSDIQSLCDLLRILFTQEEEFSANQDFQKQGLTKIIEDPDRGKILVLENDAQIIGMVNLLFTISTFTGGRVALLEDMIVHPEHRGSGSGSFLLQGALETAKKYHCTRITLLTDRSNIPAQAFYEKNGFFKSNMIPMRISLSDE